LIFRITLFIFRLVIAFIPIFIDLAYLLVNILLFIAIDFPKQIYNIFTKSSRFHTDIDGYIESVKIQQESKKAKEYINQEIECEEVSAKKFKLKKVERSLEIQIKQIDEKLKKLKQDKEQEIQFEIEKLKNDIKNLSKYKDISNTKRIGFYLMLGFGCLSLLFPILFAITVILDPYWLLSEDITGAFILIIMSIVFTFLGLFLIRPGKRILKLKALNDNLRKLENA